MTTAINEAIRIIESGQEQGYENTFYSSIYMFTTENIKGVVRALKVEAKSILTVSSSGDHLFNMLLMGAKNIETYDINIFAKYYYYFKEAAIKALDYNEFLDFFFPRPFSFKKKHFDNKTFFERVLPNISNEEAKEFWRILFTRYSGKTLYESALFHSKRYSRETYKASNDYLENRENYQALKRKLKDYNYTFYWTNILANPSNIPDKKYDILYLSNILDSIKGKTKLESFQKLKEIIASLKKFISPNGILGLCYLYCYLDDYWATYSPNKISNPDFRAEFFNDKTGYKYYPFNGINNINSTRYDEKDAIMVTRRK